MKIGDCVKLVEGGKVAARSIIVDIWENKFGGQDCRLDKFSGSYRISPKENLVMFVVSDERE